MRRFVLVVLAAVTLVACGPGAKLGGGKEGAAEALFLASKPTSASADRIGAPASTFTTTWSCPQGGSVDLKATGASIVIGPSTSVGLNLELRYNSCGLYRGDVGVAVYDGTLRATQAIKAGASAVTLQQRFVGRVLVQGAFDDFLEVDITQSIGADELASGGTLSMTLVGSIATSSGSYVFDEAVTVTGGHLTVEVKSAP